jgi:hypothetical protein
VAALSKAQGRLLARIEAAAEAGYWLSGSELRSADRLRSEGLIVCTGGQGRDVYHRDTAAGQAQIRRSATVAEAARVARERGIRVTGEYLDGSIQVDAADLLAALQGYIQPTPPAGRACSECGAVTWVHEGTTEEPGQLPRVHWVCASCGGE